MYKNYISCRKSLCAALNIYKGLYRERHVPAGRLAICIRFSEYFGNRQKRHSGENIEVNVLTYFKANPRVFIRAATVVYVVILGILCILIFT